MLIWNGSIVYYAGDQCPQCHADKSDHELRKTTEMHFICKKVSRPDPSHARNLLFTGFLILISDVSERVFSMTELI